MIRRRPVLGFESLGEDLLNTDNPDSKAECQEQNPTDVKKEETIPNQFDEVPWPLLSGHSEQVWQLPGYYGTWANTAQEQRVDPRYSEWSNVESWEKDWKEAMRKEMKSIEANKVCKLVNLPIRKTVNGCKWVYRWKTNADGSLERYKAWFVATGYSQQLGLHYDETISPMARFESLRTLLALAVQCGLCVHHMDVTTGFPQRRTKGGGVYESTWTISSTRQGRASLQT